MMLQCCGLDNVLKNASFIPTWKAQMVDLLITNALCVNCISICVSKYV